MDIKGVECRIVIRRKNGSDRKSVFLYWPACHREVNTGMTAGPSQDDIDHTIRRYKLQLQAKGLRVTSVEQ